MRRRSSFSFFSQFISKANFTISPSGVHCVPTLSRTFSSAVALSHTLAYHAAPCNRGPEYHENDASVCAQEASSTYMMPILNARVRASFLAPGAPPHPALVPATLARPAQVPGPHTHTPDGIARDEPYRHC